MNNEQSPKAILLAMLFGLIGVAEGDVRAEEHPDQSENAATLFCAAALQHKRELADLYTFRGVRRGEMWGVLSPASVAETLARVGPEGQDYLDGTGVLFYSFGADGLRLWLLDKHGIRCYSRMTVADSELVSTITGLRRAF